MAENGSHVEGSSVTGSTHTIPQQQPENMEILIPSHSLSSSPSSPTGTLSRLGFKMPTSPTAAVPGSPVAGGQVSAITVVALLDKLVNMLEAVQENQQRMEQRQADLEGAVRVVQGDVTRLSKTHLNTSNSVSKLLERSRKVSGHLKDVRERMDKQAVQVKKLEANHSHLLRRNHFKVLITQEDHEIPTSVLVKGSIRTPQPSLYDADSILPAPSVTGSIDGSRANDEGLLTISLSSDEDDLTMHHVEDEMFEGDAAMGLGPPSPYERRSDKFKRNSLKKVDSLKKVFSLQSIEKKMTRITTAIVPQEQRDRMKKSFTPNHPKSPTARASSFKVSPLTFNVKKVRDGPVPTQELGSTEEKVHVEIPALGSMDGEFVLSEEHTREGVVEQIHEMLGSTSSIKAELAINGEAPSFECKINGDHVAGLAVAEVDDDVGEDGEEEEEDKQKTPVEKAEETQIPTATVAVEQVA
ncbi:caveolae-associated protein 2a [Trematomus bernacchii]|uniref:caveolae-associated protein 2a n=1 Tax=Trematomus bernacchii TaxID=40690 RepID=UPI00146DBA03|nr:caveolae-associated protein 2a [Trematomus bernacchii]